MFYPKGAQGVEIIITSAIVIESGYSVWTKWFANMM